MDLYIIRHAESENNARPLEERIEDPGLTPLGRRQAKRLAARLWHIQPTRLFVSPFRRTLETIAPYLEQTQQTAEAWIDLHEQGGVMRGVDMETFEGRPGMTREEIRNAFPYIQMPAEIDHTGWWKCRPYEPAEAAMARAERLARRLRDEFAHTHERVALMTHGMFMSLLISALLDLPYEGFELFADISNTSVTKFMVTIPRTQMSLLNCVRHLPEEWITGVDIRHFRTELGEL
jgi:2,3-bisphosphoglycerate-dependent phosphoglycerate mutase